MSARCRIHVLSTNARLLLCSICLLFCSLLLNTVVLQHYGEQKYAVYVNDVDLYLPRKHHRSTREGSKTEHIININNSPTNPTDHLLQFAIVGFGKCGTTSVLHWLLSHPEIAALPVENFDLMRHQPEQLIEKLRALPSEKMKGYKSPVDVTLPHVLKYLTEYFPQAKLIVGVRHPVQWFESLYNFRLQKLSPLSTLPPPDDLVGPCVASARNTCTFKGEFGLFLRQLGKTEHPNEVTEFERRMYRGANLNPPNSTTFVVSNPLFLYEINELQDHPKQLAGKLTEFLGLSTPLSSSIPYHNQQKQSSSSFGNRSNNKSSTVMNICEHRRVRFELMRIARASSVWIRHYFLHEPADRHIVTSPQFDSYVKKWMIDPCTNQQEETQSAGRYILQAFRDEQEQAKQQQTIQGE